MSSASSMRAFVFSLFVSLGAARISVTVATPPIPQRAVSLAAAELRRYLHDMAVTAQRPDIIVYSNSSSAAKLIGSATTESSVIMLGVSGDKAHVNKVPLTVEHGYSVASPGDGAVVITGTDAQHVLFGVYAFLESMGCTFTTAGATLPVTANLDVFRVRKVRTDSPQFLTRGLQPFHDFLEGPDAWSIDEVKRVIESIVSMRGNIIAFHTYPLEEPAVWVGLNSSVTPSGNITVAYPTTWANTLGACCGGWGYNPMPTETLGYGAAQMYEHSCWGHPTQSGDANLCPKPRTDSDAVELFNRVGLHWQDAFKHAKALGVQTVLGTETPLTLPPPPQTPTAALQLWYSASRDDHFVTTTDCDECSGVYSFVGEIGWVYTSQQPGSIALYTYYNGKDNMLSSNSTPPSGYSRVRIEGYAPPANAADTTPLLQYINSATGHHWALTFAFIPNATAAGFLPVSGPGGILGGAFTTGPPARRSAFDYYVGAFTRLERLYGDTLDYYWTWTPENWEWDHVNVTDPLIADAVADAALMQQAHDAVGASFALASCGWVVGPLGARWYFDSVLPSSWSMSSIDMNVGNTDVDPAYANLTHRDTAHKWAIPWAEDDPGLIAPELWVGRSLLHARQAANYSVGGLLSIHWRTRATSPQIGSAHAVAWNISLAASDYWKSWALGQFGDAAVSSAMADIFIAIDSDALPRPVSWQGGPGGMTPDEAQCKWPTDYAWVDTVAALSAQMRDAVTAGRATLNNLERFDFWFGSFVYMRNIAVFECTWAAYVAAFDAIKSISDPVARQAAARLVLVDARVQLQANATELVQSLLATVSTIEGTGTTYNVISHGLWGAVGPTPTSALEALTGEPLPAAAFPPGGYDPQRPPQVRVQTVRTMIAADEPLRIRAIVLTSPSQAPLSATLFSAPAGSNSWTETPLMQAAPEGGLTRFVYTVSLPPRGANNDLQWYVRVDLPANTSAYTHGIGIPAGTIVAPGGVSCYFPPGGAASPQSVVIVPA